MGRQEVIKSRITLGPLLCSHTHSSFWILTNKDRFLSAIIWWIVTYSLLAWPCYCLCNPWIRPLLCIYTDKIDYCLRASSCEKLRKMFFFLLPSLHIFPLNIILFILGRIWLLFAVGTLTKCVPIDMKLFYWIMICQSVEIKEPEIVGQDNFQMLPSLPPLIFIQLFSSIRFKMK